MYEFRSFFIYYCDDICFWSTKTIWVYIHVQVVKGLEMETWAQAAHCTALRSQWFYALYYNHNLVKIPKFSWSRGCWKRSWGCDCTRRWPTLSGKFVIFTTLIMLCPVFRTPYADWVPHTHCSRWYTTSLWCVVKLSGSSKLGSCPSSHTVMTVTVLTIPPQDLKGGYSCPIARWALVCFIDFSKSRGC